MQVLHTTIFNNARFISPIQNKYIYLNKKNNNMKIIFLYSLIWQDASLENNTILTIYIYFILLPNDLVVYVL